MGEYDIDTEIDCQTVDDETFCSEPVQDIPVETINFHPSYDRPKWTNDIAVIRLSRAANTRTGECKILVTFSICVCAKLRKPPENVHKRSYNLYDNKRTSKSST